MIWEPEAYRRGDLAEAAALGVGSVKLWLAYVELGIMADDDVALAVMQEAAELGDRRARALRERPRGRPPDAAVRRGGPARHRVAPRQPAHRARGGVRAPVPGAGRAGRGDAVRRPCHRPGAARRDPGGAPPWPDRARGGVLAPPALRALAPRGAGCAPLCHDAAAAHGRRSRGPPGGAADGRRDDLRLRPLPPAARPRQGAGAGRLHQDPDRAPRDRRAAAARVRARRSGRPARRRAAGRRGLHAARAHLRALSAEGDRRARERRRSSSSGIPRRRPGSRSSS